MRSAKPSFRSRRVGALAAAAATFLLAGSAFGFWSAIGHGSAAGAATSAVAVTVSPGTTSDRLYPGAQTDVALQISNPNPFRVRVGSLSLDTGQGAGGFDVDGAHGACGVAALSFTGQSNGGAGWSVPPRIGSTDGSLAVDIDNALAMSAAAAAACQGATFTVHLVVGP
jgi:hypothetical protein